MKIVPKKNSFENKNLKSVTFYHSAPCACCCCCCCVLAPLGNLGAEIIVKRKYKYKGSLLKHTVMNIVSALFAFGLFLLVAYVIDSFGVDTGSNLVVSGLFSVFFYSLLIFLYTEYWMGKKSEKRVMTATILNVVLSLLFMGVLSVVSTCVFFFFDK